MRDRRQHDDESRRCLVKDTYLTPVNVGGGVKPPRWTSRQTGTRDDATNGPDAHWECCISRGPSRSTATWLAMEKTIRRFTVSFLVQQNLRVSVLRWRVFSRASHHVCMNDTRKCNKCQTFFAKIVKIFTINHILRELTFFVNTFLRKIAKSVELTRKFVKNV